jgi:hypothetical protein
VQIHEQVMVMGKGKAGIQFLTFTPELEFPGASPVSAPISNVVTITTFTTIGRTGAADAVVAAAAHSAARAAK